MLNLIVNLLCNIVGTMMLLKFMEAYLEHKIAPKWIVGMVVTAEIIAATYINAFASNSKFNTVTAACSIIIISLLFKDRIKNKIIAIILYFVTGTLAEFFTLIMVYTSAGGIDRIRTSIVQDKYYYVGAILNEAFRMLLVVILCKIRKHNNSQTSAKIMILLFSIPLSSLVCVYYVVFSIARGRMSYEGISAVWLLVLLYVNFITAVVYDEMNAVAHENLMRQIEAKEMSNKLEYYDLLMKDQREIMRIRHDMKNRLLALKSGDKSGNEAKINQMLEELDSSVRNIYTSNQTINHLLNTKMRNVELEKENLELDIDIEENLPYNDMDLTVLFGNLTDNSIDELNQMPMEKRKLKIELYTRKKNIVFSIENSTRIKQGDVNNLKTTKADKGSHEIGLKSVRKIVEKYNGTMEINWMDYRFRVDIVLFYGGEK